MDLVLILLIPACWLIAVLCVGYILFGGGGE